MSTILQKKKYFVLGMEILHLSVVNFKYNKSIQIESTYIQ